MQVDEEPESESRRSCCTQTPLSVPSAVALVKTRILDTLTVRSAGDLDERGSPPGAIICVFCGGENTVWIEKTPAGTAKECLPCNGSGVSPTGARNPCAVCSGTGITCVEEASQICPNCDGTGWQPHMSLYCAVCKGKGVIPVGEREYDYAHK